MKIAVVVDALQVITTHLRASPAATMTNCVHVQRARIALVVALITLSVPHRDGLAAQQAAGEAQRRAMRQGALRQGVAIVQRSAARQQHLRAHRQPLRGLRGACNAQRPRSVATD